MKRLFTLTALVILLFLATANTKENTKMATNAPILSQIQSSPESLPLAQDVQSGGLTINSDPNGYFSGGTGGTLGASTGGSTPTYTSAQQSLLDSLPGTLQNYQNLYGNMANTGASSYNTKIQDFLDAQRLQQANVDTQGNQNELSRIQGSRGVLDMVGQGIRSGGVQLANANAGSSSATEALARAYGILGRTQQTGVNNQYQQGLVGLQNAQHTADVQRAGGVRDLQDFENQGLGQISAGAQQQLNYLQSQLASASLPNQINIQQQMDAINNQAKGAYGQYDPALTNGAAGIAPTTTDQRRVAAQNLSNAGTAADNQFAYTSAFPAQFQNSGPATSSLPLFQLPGSKKATA